MPSRKLFIFCISDTEKAAFLLKNCSLELSKLMKKSDLVVHLGDGITDFKEILGNEFSNKTLFIRGNHDKNLGKRAYMHKVVNFNDRKIYFYHGLSFNSFWENFDVLFNKIRRKLGKTINLNWYYTDQVKNIVEKYNVIVSGHTHIPRIKKISNTVYFNPGGFTTKNLAAKSLPTAGLIKISQGKNIRVKLEILEFRKIRSKVKVGLFKSKIYDL